MANGIKIPVELEMSNISSQISSLRQMLKGVKIDTSSYKQLNKMLQDLEKTFGGLQVESKKVFSSQTEINHFQRGLSNLGAQAEVFQDVLSKVSLKDLNIDTSSFENAKKKVIELETTIENAGKVGDIFKNTDIEKQFKNGIKPNVSFEELANSFDEAASKIEKRIQDINQKIQDLEKKRVSSNAVGEEFDKAVARRTTSKIDINSRDNAAKDMSNYFGVSTKKSSAKNVDDFIKEQTESILSALEERKKMLQKELEEAKKYNTQISNTIGGLTKSKSDTISQDKRKEIKNKLGLDSLGKSNKTEDVKTLLRSKKIDTTNQQQELNKLDGITEDIVRNKAEELAASIKQTEEFTKSAVAGLMKDIQSYLSNNGFDLKQVSFRSKGENETIEEYKEYILGEIDRINKINKEAEEQLQREITLQQGNATQQRNYASTVRNAAAENQEKVEQAEAQIPVAKQELENEAEALERVAENATNAQGAIKGITEETDKAGEAAKKGAENLQTLNTATESLGQIKRIVSYWFGFHNVMRTVSSTIKGAVSTIRELDDVMTEISIVTDMSQEDLWGQMDKYASTAQEYGTSIKGVYEVSQLYYQQGLETTQVWELTTETLKMAKIAGLDYATATDYMTVAIRGFKMEMSEAQTVTDVYSAVAAATASDTEELAVAMSKTASSAESVGASFESTTAMIATMISTTRESATNINRDLTFLLNYNIIIKKEESSTGVIAA